MTRASATVLPTVLYPTTLTAWTRTPPYGHVVRVTAACVAAADARVHERAAARGPSQKHSRVIKRSCVRRVPVSAAGRYFHPPGAVLVRSCGAGGDAERDAGPDGVQVGAVPVRAGTVPSRGDVREGARCRAGELIFILVWAIRMTWCFLYSFATPSSRESASSTRATRRYRTCTARASTRRCAPCRDAACGSISSRRCSSLPTRRSWHFRLSLETFRTRWRNTCGGSCRRTRCACSSVTGARR